MGKFRNNNVIITGAATGLGQIVALEFAKEGANILIADFQTPTKTIAMINEIGGNVEYIECDLRNENDIIRMGKFAGEYFDNKIDILINNAGFNGKTQLVKDMKLEDWQYTISINLTGTMLVSREIIPYMMDRKEGKIINVASNVARRGLPYRSDYVSSKWALLGLTQTLALELADSNIRVNAVCPGPISVDRIKQLMEMHADVEGKSIEQVAKEWADVPMKRFVEPEEVSRVIQFLASDASSAMTGQALNVTGGLIMT